MNRLRLFFSQWIRAIAIFPIPFIVLGVMTIVGICMVYTDYSDNQYFMKIMAACLVAFPLTVLAPLKSYITGKKIDAPELVVSGLGIIVGIVYYMFLPFDIEKANDASMVLIIGGVLLSRATLLFIIAWTKRRHEMMTWVWWKEILLAVIMGGLAGGIIWGGISACIASLDYLFGVNVDSNAYGYVGVVSMIFIAGAIGLIHIVNQDTKDILPIYTRSMRIFGHYIFLPLTIIYGCILISYGVKILITGVRPEGMVVYMVTGYVGFGILTWLTTYPALPDSFISKAHRVLFISFLLTSFLMIQAARMRIEQYGFTIDRYFVCAIIAWIIIISIGSILFAKNRFMIMISTLLVVGIISVYGGDLSAVSVSSRSQKNILEESLAQYNIALPLGSGSLANIGTGESANKIYDTVNYLANRGNEDTIHSLVPSSERSKLDIESPYNRANYVLNYAGFDYVDNGIYDRPQGRGNEMYFSWNESVDNGMSAPVLVQGYTTLHTLNNQKAMESNIITIDRNQEKFTLDLSTYGEDLYNISTAVSNQNTTPQVKNNTVAFASGTIAITTEQMKVILTDISGYKVMSTTGDIYNIQYYRGYVLLR